MIDHTIIYRPARPVDADQIHRLLTVMAEEEGALLLAPDEISPEDIRDRIRNATNRRNRFFHVATKDEIVLGMVALESGPYRSMGHVRFMNLAVDPHHRRKGIGRELTRVAMEWAYQTPSVAKIEIQLREANTAAFKLMQSFGFVLEGRLKKHGRTPSGKDINELILALFVDERQNS